MSAVDKIVDFSMGNFKGIFNVSGVVVVYYFPGIRLSEKKAKKARVWCSLNLCSFVVLFPRDSKK